MNSRKDSRAKRQRIEKKLAFGQSSATTAACRSPWYHSIASCSKIMFHWRINRENGPGGLKKSKTNYISIYLLESEKNISIHFLESEA